MFRYKKLRRFRVFLLLWLCLALGLPSGRVWAAVWDDRVAAEEDLSTGMPEDVLTDSLEPFRELELTPQDRAEWEEADRYFGRKRSPRAGGADEWKKYASTYYYNHSSFTEAQKKFWDALDAQCSGVLNGTEDLKQSSDGTCRLPVLTYTGLTYEQARCVYEMFRYSSPQYYFLTNSFYKSEKDSQFQLSIFPEFALGKDRTAANARMKHQIEEMLSEISEESTALGKEKAAHDLICEKVDYDMNYDNMAKNKFNQTIYSVLCTDTTVCAGYSQAMSLLLNASGIDCTMVISSSHAWNMVNLDAGNGQGKSWYYTDLTWDDQPDGWIYTFFNRSREAVHQMDTASHTEEADWIPYLPKTMDAPVDRASMPEIKLQDGKVVMSASGCDIYYTLNADTPFRLRRAQRYTAPFPAAPGMRITAVSSRDGCFESRRRKISVCQVNFVLEGAAYGVSSLMLGGERIVEPGVTPPPGYTFSGWCTDPACTVAYPFSIPVQESLTLYGCYRKISYPPEAAPVKVYQVLFDSCGGNAVSPQSVSEGERARQVMPERKGYGFQGWYTSRDYASPYDFSAGVAKDMVLFAKWKANAYKVTYQANGGYIGKKSVSSKKVTVLYDGKYGKQPKPKRKGYAFLGWYTKKSGGSRIEDAQLVKITGKKTYYAHWSKVKPKKASVSSVKSGEPGKMTVKIKNMPGASGYELRYSLKSSMGSARRVKVSGREKTVSGLKKGKKYYVQVRMYQKESVSGRISRGPWSAKRSVKIKR